MELQALIKPRADGTVILRGVDKKPYTFTPNADGDVVCLVEDEKTVANALASGNFQPYNDEDFEKAESLLESVMPKSNDDDDDEDEDDEPVNLNALPVEAGTPPARFKAASNSPKRARKPRKAA